MTSESDLRKEPFPEEACFSESVLPCRSQVPGRRKRFSDPMVNSILQQSLSFYIICRISPTILARRSGVSPRKRNVLSWEEVGNLKSRMVDESLGTSVRSSYFSVQ